MQRIEPIIAFIAFVVAILVAFGVYHLVYTAPKQSINTVNCPPPIKMKETMVAKNFINTGDPISGSIVYEKWPESSLRKGFYAKGQVTPEQLESFIARRVISPGEPIAQNSVVDRKDHGILSALLKDGMRAVSIALDQNAGMSGLLNPGDIVDVIVAFNNTSKDKNEGEELNRTLLCGVRVLAIDQKLSTFSNSIDKKLNPTDQPAKSVTLEVTPQQASSLASAAKMGSLSLSLHSINDSKSNCKEASLKPLEQIKIIRGDGTQNPSQLKP